jgi:cytochrome P450
MANGAIDQAIVTPLEAPRFPGRLLAGPALPDLAARLGARVALLFGKPFRLGKRVVAARHAHVRELLERDLDFAIAPNNAAKIGEVNGGPFVLGMDRSAMLERERHALYHAMHKVDLARLRAEAQTDIDMRLAAVGAGGEIDCVGGYARPVAAGTAARLFGLAAPPREMLMEVSRSIFAHTFLNVGNDAAIRARAIRAGEYMQEWLAGEIAERRASGRSGDDLMGMLLSDGLLDDAGVRRTLGGMFVGSIDTTATCIAKILAVAVRDPKLACAMRRDSGDLRRLYGWCNEALRRWPHNPVVLRTAVADAALGGCAVKAGDAIVAWTQAAMQDPSAFDSPRRLRPDRDSGIYLHLGGGVHPCSGRAVNAFQIPLLIRGLLERGIGRVGKIGWAGPFPHRLMVKLEEEPS